MHLTISHAGRPRVACLDSTRGLHFPESTALQRIPATNPLALIISLHLAQSIRPACAEHPRASTRLFHALVQRHHFSRCASSARINPNPAPGLRLNSSGQLETKHPRGRANSMLCTRACADHEFNAAAAKPLRDPRDRTTRTSAGSAPLPEPSASSWALADRTPRNRRT